MTTQQYSTGTGRRKRAVAQTRLMPGGGAVVVNGKPLEEAIPMPSMQDIVLQPFRVTSTVNRYSASVRVIGGGVHAQATAIRHSISRALVEVDEANRPPLRKAGFMTRDPREKERKKYGLKRARKAPQYTKR